MRSRKPFALLVILGLLAALTVGCGSSDDGDSGGDDAESLTLGFSVPDLTAAFWVSTAYGVQDEAEKQGVELKTVSAGGDANADEQISQLQDFAQQDIDGLLIGATNADAVGSAVQQVTAQDIPVVDLATMGPDLVTSSVGADHYGMGEIQAQCLGKALDGKGTVGMMAGPAGQSWADDRAQGFRDTLKETAPDIEIVTQSRLADNRNSALTTMEDWLQRFPDLGGVYTASDDIGSGVVDAIDAAGKSGDIKVTTSNFSPAADQLLQNGKVVCVSAQKIVEQGREAVRTAIAAANGEEVEKSVVTPVVEITKDNMDEVDLDELQAPEGFKP